MALPLPRRFSSQSHSPLRPVIIGIILTCRGDEAVVRHFIDDDLWFLGAPHPRVGHRENGFSYPFPKPAGAWQCSAPDHWHLMPSGLESRALPRASRSLVGSSITKRVGKPVLRWASRLLLLPSPAASKSGRFLGSQTGRSAPRVGTSLSQLLRHTHARLTRLMRIRSFANLPRGSSNPGVSGTKNRARSSTVPCWFDLISLPNPDQSFFSMVPMWKPACGSFSCRPG
jgi:hypothetical protein